MRKLIFLIFFISPTFGAKAQSCQEMMEYVQADSYGTTYNSYTSDAISKVTFYEVVIDYTRYYFAVVCFKQQYSFDCNEYIYQVSSNTEMYYSMNYLTSAGKAFWKYIQPYNDNLDCGPDFE